MTNPKTEHKNRKAAPANHADARRVADHAPGSNTSASSALIEACNRLSQKLDEITGLIREQLEAGRDVHQTAPPSSADRATAAGESTGVLTAERAATAHEPRKPEQPGHGSETKSNQDQRESAPPPGPITAPALEQPAAGTTSTPPPQEPGAGGQGTTSAGVSRLIDTLTHSRNGWQEQAADLSRALEAIMVFLENQATTTAPSVDISGIMDRLKDLEEQQQRLQSQLNTNRWGP